MEMEKLYGVGITNRYSCFIDNEDADPAEAKDSSTTEKDKDPKKRKPRADLGPIRGSENRGQAQHPRGKEDTNPTENKDTNEKDRESNKPKTRRDGGYFRGTDNRGRGQNFRENEDADHMTEAKDTNEKDRDNEKRRPRNDGGFSRGGSGDRGRGQNFRGSRGGPGGYRKREFDRQSGSDKSGVKAVDKRDGAGSRNWGTYKDDDVEVTGERTAEKNTEERADGHGQEPGLDNSYEGDAAPDQEPTEEQPKLMTLDEWKAMQEPRAKPVFNLRKAGEGEDQSQWKKMTLKKKEDEPEEEEEEGEYEECHQRAGRQKQILDVNFTFADSRRGFGQRSRPGGRGGRDRGERVDRDSGNFSRGGGNFERGGGNFDRGSGNFERGGRGGFRGGFSRGGGRGGFSREQQERSTRQAAPKVDDEFDFPCLG